MDLGLIERIDKAVKETGISEPERTRFIAFCTEWYECEGEMFYGGYANEWASLFKNGREYEHADNERINYILPR